MPARCLPDPAARKHRTRADYLNASGLLLVTREPPPAPPPAPGQPPMVAANPAEGVEILVALRDDGRVVGFNGHVDRGTGIRTALAQIVAEELDVGLDAVEMVLGDTATAPNQGPTIASASIQIHAQPLRQAAAQARAFLLSLAAEALGADAAMLTVQRGVVGHGDKQTDYAALLSARRFVLRLDPSVAVKRVDAYRVVGRSLLRVDIPAKVAGGLVFVHDQRLPGMLHGRVVRPPYAGADHGVFIGNTLESVDESSIAHNPGVRAVVVIRDFVGVVAEREEHAERAAAELKVIWRPWPGLPQLDDLAQALRDNPALPRQLVDEGDVDRALATAAQAMDREYVWPYQMHAAIGPSCALAWWHGEGAVPALTVWSGTQNPHVLRYDVSRLMQLPDVAVDVVRMEAAGCYGRNGADDVTADAALLSRAVGALVGAVIAASVGYVAGARLTPVLGAERVICWVTIGMLPISLPATLWTWPETPVSTTAWVGFAYVGAISMWAAFFAWYRALAVGGAVAVSQVQVLQPFFAIAFAVPLLGEAADATTLAYAVAVVATVVAGRHFNNRAPRHGPGRAG